MEPDEYDPEIEFEMLGTQKIVKETEELVRTRLAKLREILKGYQENQPLPKETQDDAKKEDEEEESTEDEKEDEEEEKDEIENDEKQGEKGETGVEESDKERKKREKREKKEKKELERMEKKMARKLKKQQKKEEKEREKRAKDPNYKVKFYMPPEEFIQDDSFLMPFLRTMKFDCNRAAKLVGDYWEYRKTKIGVEERRIRREHLKEHILASGFIMLPNIRDKYGRRLVYTRPRFLKPTENGVEETLKVMWYVIEEVMQDEITQKLGAVVINEPVDAGYANFDRRFVSVFTESVQRRIPLRLARASIVNPPYHLQFLFTIFKMFLTDKFKERIHVVGYEHNLLLEHFDKDQIFEHLGGTVPVDFEGWLQSCK